MNAGRWEEKAEGEAEERQETHGAIFRGCPTHSDVGQADLNLGRGTVWALHSARGWCYAKLPCIKHLFLKINCSFNFQICHVYKTKSDSSMKWIISKFLVCFFIVFFLPIYVHKYNVPWCKTEKMRGYGLSSWFKTETLAGIRLRSHLAQKVTCEDKTAHLMLLFPWLPLPPNLHFSEHFYAAYSYSF